MFGSEVPLERFVQPSRLLFLPILGDVEEPEKHQEGDLLDNRERVGDPALPEFEPELVDLVLEGTGNHRLSPPCVFWGWNLSTIAIRSSISVSLNTPSTPSELIEVKGWS